jgi:hypothetical protein
MAKAKSPSGRRTQPVQPAIAGNAVAAEANAEHVVPQVDAEVGAKKKAPQVPSLRVLLLKLNWYYVLSA